MESALTGLANAYPHPIHGGERVARACIAFARAAPHRTILERTVNGRPGLVAQQDGVTVTVWAFEIDGERIKHIWAMGNPDRLKPWATG